jgi:hypothetical protein
VRFLLALSLTGIGPRASYGRFLPQCSPNAEAASFANSCKAGHKPPDLSVQPCHRALCWIPLHATLMLLAKYPALPPAPTSGVTIAPKGGVAREATAGEPRAIGPGASWADVAGQAGENLLPSAQRFGSDLLNVVQHPKETGKAFLKAAAGGVEKLIPGEQEHEPYANAVGQFFADRYGGMEAFKKTLAEDPVGFAAWPRSFPGANWLLREHPAWLVKSVALPERSDVPSIRSICAESRRRRRQRRRTCWSSHWWCYDRCRRSSTPHGSTHWL